MRATTLPPERWRHLWRALDVFAWVALAWVLVALYRQYSFDLDQYIRVDEIHVSDHVSGGDPSLWFDPVIGRNFWATRTVRVHPTNLATPLCTAVSRVRYEKGMPFTGLTLARFIGHPCELPPGSYTVRASWLLDEGGVIRASSNDFNVVGSAEHLTRLLAPAMPEPLPAPNNESMRTDE